MRTPTKNPRIAGIPLNKSSAISLGKGVIDSLLNRKVDTAERERRLKICHSCEHFNPPRCTLCGCFMNFKTTLSSSNCPVGKWLPVGELTIDQSGETEKTE
mgnify:CR=1 FL=1